MQTLCTDEQGGCSVKMKAGRVTVGNKQVSAKYQGATCSTKHGVKNYFRNTLGKILCFIAAINVHIILDCFLSLSLSLSPSVSNIKGDGQLA